MIDYGPLPNECGYLFGIQDVRFPVYVGQMVMEDLIWTLVRLLQVCIQSVVFLAFVSHRTWVALQFVFKLAQLQHYLRFGLLEILDCRG